MYRNFAEVHNAGGDTPKDVLAPLLSVGFVYCCPFF
jgi:hypothetical protein